MSFKTKVAIASLVWPTALALLTWGLAQSGFVYPSPLIRAAIVAGAGILLLSSALWIHISWSWLRHKNVRLATKIAILAAVSIGVIGSVWGISRWKSSQENHGPPFRVDFADNANSLSTFPQSPFVGRISIGVSGDPATNFISEQTFGFGVANIRNRTAKGIQAILVRVKYEGGIEEALHIPLPIIGPLNGGNLNPGDGVKFQLVQFYDASSAGIAKAQFVSREQLDFLKSLTAPNIISTEYIIASPQLHVAGSYNIQRPIGSPVYLDIGIFADDVEPTYARFQLIQHEKLYVHLIAQGSSLPNYKK